MSPPRPLSTRPQSTRPWLIGLGLLVLALLVLLAAGMRNDPRELPSVRLGKPWPALALPQLKQPGQVDGAVQWRGQARIVNVWASWCGTCREEHPVLLSLAATLQAQGRAQQLIGLNYKDAPGEARAWLNSLGDPFSTSLVDADGRMGIELGVYGAPETFVVDAEGRIAFRHAGALTPEIVARELLPRLVAAPSAPARPGPGAEVAQQAANPASPTHPASAARPVIATGPAALAGPAASAAADPFAPERWGQAEADRLHTLSAELRCLVCQNESLADSTAGLALDLKREIAGRMAAGDSDEQIRQFLVERYGDFVTYRPPLTGRTLLLWLGPLLLLGGALWLLLRHLRAQAAARPMAAPAVSASPATPASPPPEPPAALTPPGKPHP